MSFLFPNGSLFFISWLTKIFNRFVSSKNIEFNCDMTSEFSNLKHKLLKKRCFISDKWVLYINLNEFKLFFKTCFIQYQGKTYKELYLFFTLTCCPWNILRFIKKKLRSWNHILFVYKKLLNRDITLYNGQFWRISGSTISLLICSTWDTPYRQYNLLLFVQRSVSGWLPRVLQFPVTMPGRNDVEITTLWGRRAIDHDVLSPGKLMQCC